MEAKELTHKTREELLTLERELRAKIRDLRFAFQTGTVKAVREVRVHKRDLARVCAALKSAPTPTL